MKRITLAISFSILIYGTALAQFSGQLSTPRTMDNGASLGGIYAGIYDDAIGVLGQYRYGVGGYTDIGFKLGLLDLDGRNSDAAIDFAFDVKYQVMEMKMRDPFELSVDGAVELSHINRIVVIDAVSNAPYSGWTACIIIFKCGSVIIKSK